MIGNPTETEEEVLDSKKFIIENDIDAFGVTISTPLPGTKLWDIAKERGMIPKEIDWRKFNTNNNIINLSEIPNKRLNRLWKDFLNLTLERNAQVAPINLFRAALKHPGKAVKRLLDNPKSTIVIAKRIIKGK